MIWTERMGHLRNWHKVPVAGEGGRGAQGGVVGRTSLLEVGGGGGKEDLPSLPCKQSVGERDRWISPAVSEPWLSGSCMLYVATEEVGEPLDDFFRKNGQIPHDLLFQGE